jgi:hypothetical protein
MDFCNSWLFFEKHRDFNMFIGIEKLLNRKLIADLTLLMTDFSISVHKRTISAQKRTINALLILSCLCNC